MVANSPYSSALRDWCFAQKRGNRLAEKKAADRLDAIGAADRDGVWRMDMATPEQTTDAETAWKALVDAAKGWALHLDQWDKFKFQTQYGPVYLTIGRGSEYPDSFEEVV